MWAAKLPAQTQLIVPLMLLPKHPRKHQCILDHSDLAEIVPEPSRDQNAGHILTDKELLIEYYCEKISYAVASQAAR